MPNGTGTTIFKQVIDTKVKDWGNDSKMNQYLRPITLFSSKFDDYLNQTPHKPIETKKENNLSFYELEKMLKGE